MCRLILTQLLPKKLCAPPNCKIEGDAEKKIAENFCPPNPRNKSTPLLKESVICEGQEKYRQLTNFDPNI